MVQWCHPLHHLVSEEIIIYQEERGFPPKVLMQLEETNMDQLDPEKKDMIAWNLQLIYVDAHLCDLVKIKEQQNIRRKAKLQPKY